MDFVAMDFEKANDESASGCQVGLARVRNGSIVDTFESVIRPPDDHLRLGGWQQANLGLTIEDLKSAPTMAELLSEVESFIGQDVLVAHQASTDVSIFRRSTEAWGVALPKFQVICSLNFSRALISERPHGLATLCERFGIPLPNHHSAIDDAVACANLMLELLELSEQKDFKSLHEKFGYSFERSSKANYFTNSKLQEDRDAFYSNLSEIHEFFRQDPTELEFVRFPLAGQTISTIRGFFDLDFNELSSWVEAIGGVLVDFDFENPSDFILQGNRPGTTEVEKRFQTLAIVKFGKSAMNEAKFAQLLVECLSEI